MGKVQQIQKQKLKDKNKTWSTVKTIITSIIITKTGRQSDIFIFYNFIPIAGRAATWTKGYQYLLFQRKEARLSASPPLFGYESRKQNGGDNQYNILHLSSVSKSNRNRNVVVVVEITCPPYSSGDVTPAQCGQ